MSDLDDKLDQLSDELNYKKFLFDADDRLKEARELYEDELDIEEAVEFVQAVIYSLHKAMEYAIILMKDQIVAQINF